jgi:membrane protein insertase Oxa1/YidC/SpoIIIJ
MNKQMLYFMPVLTVIIGISLPAGLTLYWLFSTLLTVAQQKIMLKKTDSSAKPKDGVIEGQVVNK